MKTPLQELIEWLKEYRLNTMSLMAIGDYEQGQIDVLSDVIKRTTDLEGVDKCSGCDQDMIVEYDGKWCPNCDTYISTKD